MSIFALRLKEARLAAKLSQEALGVLSGIDEASASARMNQYEKGKHQPDFSVVERIAMALNLPAAYFYAVEDDEATLLNRFYRLNTDGKQRLMKAAAELPESMDETSS